MRRVLCPASPVPPEPSVPATTPPADRMPHHPLPGLRHNSAVSPDAVTKLLKDESDQVPLRTAPVWFGSALFLPSIAPRSHFAPPRPHTQAAPTHTVLGQESSVLVLSPLSGLHSRRRFRVKHPVASPLRTTPPPPPPSTPSASTRFSTPRPAARPPSRTRSAAPTSAPSRWACAPPIPTPTWSTGRSAGGWPYSTSSTNG